MQNLIEMASSAQNFYIIRNHVNKTFHFYIFLSVKVD